ncbi:MAG: polysaccharide pyruvyl transferase family protein [Ruminococcaceae bacterium]|nr:polysaccharide pyruvyl transferase family protein [Oscillospiraceae bacterium]
MSKKFLLYGHGGSENHGCEAIVRGTVDILSKEFEGSSFVLAKQDSKLGLDGEVGLPVESILLQDEIGKFSLKFVIAGAKYALTKSRETFYRFKYKNLLSFLKKSKVDAAFSIGGDNYCYGMHNSLYYLNSMLRSKTKRVLWGCSIEPESLKDPELVKDLDSLDLIVAREPITYNALSEALKNAKVILRPDPAFALKAVKKPLPESFNGKTVVGINMSPVVSHVVDERDITFENYENMMAYILENTEHSILLIPHVTWAKNDDRTVMSRLYEKYKESGRVHLISKFDTCEELKGYIAQCDMFIGARTHSTIAAYSSCVPCVVVGYSVKADGIATELFGTTENYVIPSQDLKEADALTNAFIWLDENRKDIKDHLEKVMPGYIESAFSAAAAVKDILGERE